MFEKPKGNFYNSEADSSKIVLANLEISPVKNFSDFCPFQVFHASGLNPKKKSKIRYFKRYGESTFKVGQFDTKIPISDIDCHK